MINLLSYHNTIVVTGGTRGIGRSIVINLLNSGYRVAAIYSSNTEQADKMKDEIMNSGIDIHNFETYKVSVSNSSEIAKTFKEIRDRFGMIYGLVNNAGITRDNFLMMMKEEEWQDVISTNLVGLFTCTREILPYLEEGKLGKIINLSSISGIKGTPSQVNYATTKSAVIGFTRTLAVELLSKNISVYSIAPGYIETEMLNTIPAKILNKYKEDIPMKRFGDTDEISELITLLMNDNMKYATGQNFILDGGVCLV